MSLQKTRLSKLRTTSPRPTIAGALWLALILSVPVALLGVVAEVGLRLMF